MKKIYLCCPYSHKDRSVILQRFEAANKAAAYLMQKGYLVFSPSSHSHPIADHIGNNTEHDFWLKQDFSFFEWADEICILTMPGWEESKGIKLELEHIKGWQAWKGFPVWHLSPQECGIEV